MSVRQFAWHATIHSLGAKPVSGRPNIPRHPAINSYKNSHHPAFLYPAGALRSFRIRRAVRTVRKRGHLRSTSTNVFQAEPSRSKVIVSDRAGLCIFEARRFASDFTYSNG